MFIIPCYPSILDPQLGTPYPEVCGFDTNSGLLRRWYFKLQTLEVVAEQALEVAGRGSLEASPEVKADSPPGFGAELPAFSAGGASMDRVAIEGPP